MPISNAGTGLPSMEGQDGKYLQVVAGSAEWVSLGVPASALTFKGLIDCSGNPNYPAAAVGDVYVVSVMGKIGGGSGPDVEVEDMLMCLSNTASGTHAAVGANWNILQGNTSNRVTGPASATDGNIALFDGTSGRAIKNSTYSPASFATAAQGSSADAAYTQAVTNATALNTISTIVKRDGSGNFAAGTITANLTGNASGSSGSCTGNAATATSATSAGKSTNLVGGNGTTLLGSMPYQSGTDATTMLAPNTTASKRFMTQTGTGTNGAAPAWAAIAGSDIPTLNQDTTGTAAKATNLVGGNGTTLLGSMPYQSNTDATTLLAPNTTTSEKFLRMTGTGTNGAAPAWDNILSANVQIPNVNATPGYEVTLDKAMDYIWSSGRVFGFALTDNGDGTISLASGVAMLRSSDTMTPYFSSLYACAVPATAGIALTDNSSNFVYAQYHATTPLIGVTTDITAVHATDKVLLYSVTRVGTQLDYLAVGSYQSDFMAKYAKKVVARSGCAEHAYGALTTEAGTRRLSITAGAFYFVNEQITTGAFNTNASDTFTYIYRNGAGGFTRSASQTTINNTQYDNGTGTLATLGSGDYGVHWVYLVLDEPTRLAVVYGQGSYANVAAAEAAGIPTTLPPECQKYSTGVLVAKILVRKNATNLYSIQNPFTSYLTTSTATEHNGLAGLQGGVADNYYHLTNTEYTNLQASNIPLGSTYKINSTSLVSTLENGFVSTTDHTVSVNETNRQITITPASSAFQIVSGGILRSYTGAQTSTAWNNTTGSKFVYFDSSGVLTTAEVAWTLQADEAPVAYIYWDATAGSAPILLLEDHPNTWSQAEWLHHHQVFGARWISGLTNYNNAITTGSPNSDGRNTCIGMSGGVIADEALRHTVQNSVAGGNWQQDLGPTSTSITTSNGASMKVVYWNGVRWVRTTTNGRFPFLWNSGTNRPEYVTSGGTVTTVADDQFFAYFVCISGDWRTGQQVYLIPFNTTYSSLAAAQAGASFNALAASLGSLPAPEIVVAHRLIFNTNYSGGGTYDAAVKYTRLNEVLDLRPYSFAQLNSINTVPGSHASTHLTGGADLLALPDSVRIAIDGQRFAIGAGAFVNLPMNYNATVTGWRLFNIARVGASDQISIEVRKCTYADYGASHPVTGDKISASAPITLASAGDYKNADTTLTGWTTAITSGDILQFYVNSATDITSVVVELQLTRA